MAWLDSRVWCHPKLTPVSDKAFRMWVCSIAYSDGFNTRGILSPADLKTIGATPKITRELVEARLWISQEFGGILISSWSEHNGKRDERKAADRDRKRNARQKTSAGQSAGNPVERPQDARALTVLTEVTDEGPTTNAAATTNSRPTEARPHGQKTEPPEPAAAEPLEAPRTATIHEVCERHRADLKIVEPLAQQLDRDTFEDVANTVETRCRTGNVTNPAGLLVQLLRETIRDHQRHQHAVRPHTIHDELAQIGRDTARTNAPIEVALELAEACLRRHHNDDNSLVTHATDAWTVARAQTEAA